MAKTERLTAHVPATVIAPFHDLFVKGEKIEIDRVAGACTMFGAAGRPHFIPSRHVDDEAQKAVREQFNAVRIST
jgi:hypothetical protein